VGSVGLPTVSVPEQDATTESRIIAVATSVTTRRRESTARW
jgi:hypothetical protein